MSIKVFQTDGEFQGILDSNFEAVDDIFIGMTQYESAEAFNNIQVIMAESQEQAAFLDTFDIQCFQLVRVNRVSFVIQLLGIWYGPFCESPCNINV